MKRMKLMSVATILAATQLLSCIGTGSTQENRKQVQKETTTYELDGETIELEVCQAPLTMEKYRAIKVGRVENGEIVNGTFLQDASEIVGCTFQYVKSTDEKNVSIYQVISENWNGSKTIIVAVYEFPNGSKLIILKDQKRIK